MFDMLDFALDYRPAIDAMTNDRGNKLRRYELDNKEWEMVEQLRDVLQVRYQLSHRPATCF